MTKDLTRLSCLKDSFDKIVLSYASQVKRLSKLKMTTSQTRASSHPQRHAKIHANRHLQIHAWKHSTSRAIRCLRCRKHLSRPILYRHREGPRASVSRQSVYRTMCLLKVTRPSFFGGVPSYFETLWNPHLYFYRKSNTWIG